MTTNKFTTTFIHSLQKIFQHYLIKLIDLIQNVLKIDESPLEEEEKSESESESDTHGSSEKTYETVVGENESSDKQLSLRELEEELEMEDEVAKNTAIQKVTKKRKKKRLQKENPKKKQKLDSDDLVQLVCNLNFFVIVVESRAINSRVNQIKSPKYRQVNP